MSLSMIFLGRINEIVSGKSSNTYLAQQGFEKGLAECVFANRAQGSTINPGPMASTVEAIVGAAFNDGEEKIKAARGVMDALGISWPE